VTRLWLVKNQAGTFNLLPFTSGDAPAGAVRMLTIIGPPLPPDAGGPLTQAQLDAWYEMLPSKGYAYTFQDWH